MATVNFSVPDDIKKAFNEEFAGRNKSAIVAELMQRAIDESREARRRQQAIDRLLSRRLRIGSRWAGRFRELRESGRP